MMLARRHTEFALEGESLSLHRIALKAPALIAMSLASAVMSARFQARGIISGTVFGIAIALYLAVFEGRRKLDDSAAFVFACCVSWPVSRFVTQAIMFSGVFGASPLGESIFPSCALFIGGSIGAFIVMLVGTVLYAEHHSRAETWLVALLGSLGGGILGLLGGWLEHAVGQHPEGTIPVAVFAVWQVGVALMLGFVLIRDNKRIVSS